VRPRQHVWLGPDATSWEVDCEACLHTRESLASQHVLVKGTLSPRADVGFTSCRRGHRIVVRRIGRSLARAV
jgi:hypothetical protein